MASTIKVDTIDTPDGTGNITVSRPLSGSGASLTSLSAANLTGTLPAIDGASLTNISINAKTIHASYDLSTASGNQDITGFGFSPSALFGWFIINPSDDWGFGFTDFTMSRSLHTTNTTTAVLQGSAGFALFRISSGNDQIAAASTITDGVRLAWTKTGSPTGTGLLYLMGIK